MDIDIHAILAEYPFLSYLTYGGTDYVGIIQNADEQITTIYDFSSVKTPAARKRFLEFGDQWWGESNRLIPINVFLKADWSEFKSCVKTLNSKDVEVKVGPATSLKEMALKRSKRRSITLVRRLP